MPAPPASRAAARGTDALLAWYFVTVWGTGFIATKIGLQHAAPFTFLTLRFAFGLACLIPILILTRPRWPGTPREWGHVVAAGLILHALHLGASHYTQYLGMSAGITAVLLSIQPLLTALIATRWMGEQLTRGQWAGVAIGLAGVTLIVWHKIDIREVTAGSLVAVTLALAGITIGTLYQRVFCPSVDLRSTSFIHFAVTISVLAPLAWWVEGGVVHWSWSLAGSLVFLVIGASILAVNALHLLMRRGAASRVTSLFYLTPIFPVVIEFGWFGVVPSALSVAGIAITCFGVGLAAWYRPAESR